MEISVCEKCYYKEKKTIEAEAAVVTVPADMSFENRPEIVVKVLREGSNIDLCDDCFATYLQWALKSVMSRMDQKGGH